VAALFSSFLLDGGAGVKEGMDTSLFSLPCGQEIRALCVFFFLLEEGIDFWFSFLTREREEINSLF